MRLTPFATLALCILTALPCATRADAAPAATTAPHYVDVYEYFTTDTQFEAWYDLTSALRRNFDDICGDTFCEGDYSNIESLRYRCSVDDANGSIGQCVWVFAGSYEEIDPDTGSVAVNARTWTCRSAIGHHTTVDALLETLAGDEPLYTTLPGSRSTIYDGLVGCL